MFGVSYKHIAMMAAIAAVVVYASNKDLPIVGNVVRRAIG